MQLGHDAFDEWAIHPDASQVIVGLIFGYMDILLSSPSLESPDNRLTSYDGHLLGQMDLYDL
jgi:hypothetical protein